VVLELIRHAAKDPGERAAAVVGRLVAHLATLRQMSLSVAVMLQAGENPNSRRRWSRTSAPRSSRRSRDRSRAARCRAHDRLGSDLQQVLGFLVQRAPSFSLRGGTREILRASSRAAGPAMNELRTILDDVVTRLFTDRVTKDLVEDVEKGQLAGGAVAGGRGERPDPAGRPRIEGRRRGTWGDAYIVMRAAGRHAVPLPLVETIVGAWLLSESGLDVPTGPLTVAPVHRDETLRLARPAAAGG